MYFRRDLEQTIVISEIKTDRFRCSAELQLCLAKGKHDIHCLLCQFCLEFHTCLMGMNTTDQKVTFYLANVTCMVNF